MTVAPAPWVCLNARSLAMSQEEMSPLSIRLFGPFAVEVNGVPLRHLRTRKGQWLLALLTLRSGSVVERA